VGKTGSALTRASIVMKRPYHNDLVSFSTFLTFLHDFSAKNKKKELVLENIHSRI
jgi:hypothetical protein